MRILSLKGVLLRCLEQVLFNNREEKITSFTNFSQKVENDPYFFFKSTLKPSVYWRKIPLQRTQTSSQLLYTSALPQLWASNRNSHKDLSIAAFSEEVARQLSRVRFQATFSDLDHKSSSARLISQLWDEFQIETQRPGWISWELSSTGIDMWIQQNQNGFQIDRKYPLIDINQNPFDQVNHSFLNPSKKVDRDHITSNTNLTAAQPNVKHPDYGSKDKSNHALQTNRFQTIHSPNHQAPPLTKSPADITQPSAEKAPLEASDRHFSDTIKTPKTVEGETTAPGTGHVVIDTGPSRTKHSPLVTAPAKSSLAKSSLAELAQSPTPQEKSAPNSSSQLLKYRSAYKPAQNHDRQQQTAQTLIWEAQYTHARCCTLLRLWRETLQAASSETKKSSRQPLASLLLSSSLPSCVERIDTPHTQNLVQALTEIADNMFWIPYRWPAKQYFLFLKASTQLCQAFEAFYRTEMSGFHIPIPTRPTPEQTELSLQFQARFALVNATQNSLKVLLESHLDADAPTEL